MVKDNTLPEVNLGISILEGVKVPPRSKFLSRWKYRDKVFIDNDESITAYIKGFMFSESSEQIRITYFAGGISYEIWVDERRLTRAD